MGQAPKARQEHVESLRLVEAAFDLARSIGITRLIVQADELQDIRILDKSRDSEIIIWLTRGGEGLPLSEKRKDQVVAIPNAPLTRMSQLKVGLLYAIMNGYVGLDETVLCLSGVAGSQRLDTLLITNPQRDFPWFRKHDVGQTQEAVATGEFVRVVEVALRLASEGREGRPIGTILVLGSMDELSGHLRQLVLNPCEGHPQRDRNIHDDHFFETVREFAALDGAFTINNRGVVESAGTYIDAPVSRTQLRSGLGARHTAAAALTACTPSIAVVVSASSGTVTVFHEGHSILELEKPQISPTAVSDRKMAPPKGKPARP